MKVPFAMNPVKEVASFESGPQHELHGGQHAQSGIKPVDQKPRVIVRMGWHWSRTRVSVKSSVSTAAASPAEGSRIRPMSSPRNLQELQLTTPAVASASTSIGSALTI